MKDLVLICPPCPEMLVERLEPNLGILYVATVAKLKGYDVAISNLAGLQEREWQVPTARYYGFPTLTPNYPNVLSVRDYLRERNPTSLFVAGGPHATAVPLAVGQDFDYVVMGEGEHAMLDILEGKFPPGIVIGGIVEDLDSLPFVDYSLVDFFSYQRTVLGERSPCILSTRGCPHQCAFCNSIVGACNSVRMRSIENVVAEMDQLHSQFGCHVFRFQDDLFAISKKRVLALRDALQGRYKYRCFARVDQLLDLETAHLLFESGCRHVAVGVESGSDLILQSMRKGQTASDIRKGISNAQEAGLIVRVFLLLGFPPETKKTVDETLKLMEECKPDEFAIYPFVPYPGIPVWESPSSYGLTWVSSNLKDYFQVYGKRIYTTAVATTQLDRGEVTDLLEYAVEKMEDIALCRNRSKF